MSVSEDKYLYEHLHNYVHVYKNVMVFYPLWGMQWIIIDFLPLILCHSLIFSEPSLPPSCITSLGRGLSSSPILTSPKKVDGIENIMFHSVITPLD